MSDGFDVATVGTSDGFDVATVKKDFPLLDRVQNGRPLVFLDSAASSQKPRQVLDAMTRYYETSHANVHRGAYALASEATEAFEQARLKVARFIGAASEREVDLRQERHRGDQPRRPLVGTRQPRARATPSCCRRWSTTPTSCRG